MAARRAPARTARRQRALQDVQEARDRKKSPVRPHAMQAGARRYPAPPLPKQHQSKPGKESQLKPAPMFEAPYYRGSGKLQDKVAIVTGGDSGIGRAVAVLFAREGADVIVLYLDEHDDAHRTAQLVEAEGRRCLLISGDLTARRFCRRAVKRVIDEFGRIDVLVNNAAFQLHVNSFEELSEEQFDLTMKTNLYGYFHMSQLVVPHMQPGSAIVNTSSVTAEHGSAHLLDYSLTKGGISTFTRSLAGALMSRGIRVNAVAPGPVWTPLNPADAMPERVSKFGANVPMKRPAQPEEISPAYVFLASAHCASYITGEILPVVGGYAEG